MSPWLFLCFAMAVTVVAVVVDVAERRRRRRALGQLAGEWGLNYSPTDRFGLTTRIASNFPIPGAADLRATDLIYGTEGDFYRYLLTAEFTTGVLHSKKRRRRVCTFRESKTAGMNTGITVRGNGNHLPPLVLAPSDFPVIEQYQKLYESEIASRSTPVGTRQARGD